MGRPKRLQNPQSFLRFCRLNLSLSAASAVLVAGPLFLLSWQFRVFAIIKPLPQFGSIAPWTILLNSMLGMALLFLAGGTDRPKWGIFRILSSFFATAAFLGAGLFLIEIVSARPIANLDQWWFQSSIGLLSAELSENGLHSCLCAALKRGISRPGTVGREET
jgi:hypothetical protein